ncbi:MAG: hypothetical protein U0Q11_04470 [Vicinamibacterales bacterium]
MVSKADITIYRPTTGGMVDAEVGQQLRDLQRHRLGIARDLPEPGDYDGDGKLDLAIYRPSTGGWWIAWSATNFSTYQGYPWGLSSDVPVWPTTTAMVALTLLSTVPRMVRGGF